MERKKGRERERERERERKLKCWDTEKVIILCTKVKFDSNNPDLLKHGIIMNSLYAR